MSYEILVTGGAGFIGSNLVRELSSENNVTIVDDLSEGHEQNLQGLKANFIKEDIRNAEFVEKIFNDIKFDKVFHLAASFANQKSVEYPMQDLDINGKATLHILEQCKKTGVKKFVYASSSCIYGATDKPMEEEMKPLPETPYGITKLLGEYYTQFFHDYHKLDTTIVRYFNVYGPGEYPGQYRNVIPKFLNLAFQKKPLQITGTGEESRDFTFVGDAVKATILASEKKQATGQTLNIGTGMQTRVIDLANEINTATNNPSKIEFVEQRKWDHISHRQAKVDKMKNLLGFTPKTTLKEGIHITTEWFKKSVL